MALAVAPPARSQTPTATSLGTALVGLLKYADARPIFEAALASALALNRPDRAAETRISLGLLQALALLVVIRKRLVDRPLHERFLVLA